MLLRVNDRRIIDGPTDKIADAAQRLNRLFANTRPTPATPEGLRLLRRVADNEAAMCWLDADTKDAILSALQPQAQGGE